LPKPDAQYLQRCPQAADSDPKKEAILTAGPLPSYEPGKTQGHYPMLAGYSMWLLRQLARSRKSGATLQAIQGYETPKQQGAVPRIRTSAGPYKGRSPQLTSNKDCLLWPMLAHLQCGRSHQPEK
jgi:hypothetical protein